MITKLHYKIIGLIFFCFGISQSYGQTTYTWVGSSGSSWTTTTNWLPNRVTPATTDVLQFNSNTALTITGVPTQTIGQLFVSGTTAITLNTAGVENILSISGGTGADLIVDSGAQLNVAQITNSNAFTISILTGTTGSIKGSITFSSATANTSNKILVADAGALVFNNGSTVTQSTNSTSNLFGNTGTQLVAIFATGSTFIQSAGENPFGFDSPNSKVTFQTGSLYKSAVNTPPSLSGRTYANFEWSVGIQSADGTNPFACDDLIVSSGTLNINLTTGGHSIKGNISVASGAALNFAPAAAATINFNGSTAQTISNAGTLTFGSNATLVIANSASPIPSVTFNNNQIVSGPITVNSGSILATSGVLTSTSVVNGILKINQGGSVLGAYTYGTTSSLIYDGASTQGVEWNAGATTSPVAGLGIPAAVTVKSGILNFITTAGTPGSISVLNTATLNVNQDIFGNSLSNDGTIIVATDKVVNINNAFVNTKTAADVVFNNGSSLIQNNSVANTGNITYKRNTTILADNLNFVYLGSPVANQTLSGMWMTANSDSFYSFNTANSGGQDWLNASASSTMNAGRGYIARAVLGSTGWTTLGTKYTVNFTGKPNNGDIPFGIINNGGENIDNLIANPYPSALDLLAFSTDATNSNKITGNYYFWTHNTAINTGGNYSKGDFSIYNVYLEVGTGNTPPDRYVDAGQGFFAEASATAGTVTFKNSHRVSGFNNAFYKTNKKSVQSDKIWLNLYNNNGAFKQQLLAYADDNRATNGFDPNFDAKTFDGNPIIDFYGVVPNSNYKLTIQSRNANSFTDNDIVPLGYKSSTEGDFTIAIDHFDGKFAGKIVYLHDYFLRIDYNLSEKPYTFNTKAGTYNYRFELRYKSYLTNPPETGVVIVNDSQWFKVKSKIKNIKNIVVFDILGRKLLDKSDLNSTEFIATGIQNEEPLIVRITLIDGTLVVKKI